MALKSWDEVGPEPLAFPIGGHTYVLRESYKTGLRIQRLFADEKAIAGMTNADLWKLGLGDLYDEMVKADVPSEAVARAGITALTFYRHGRAAAEFIWENDLDPEALAAAAAQVQAKDQTETSTGAVKGTRSRASTSGTRSRRK